MILCVVFFWFAGFGWGSYGGWWSGGARNHYPRNAYNGYNSPNGTAKPNGPTGTNPANPAGTNNNATNSAANGNANAVLHSTDRLSYVGQQASLQNVAVQHDVIDNFAWVGARTGRECWLCGQAMAAIWRTAG